MKMMATTREAHTNSTLDPVIPSQLLWKGSGCSAQWAGELPCSHMQHHSHALVQGACPGATTVQV